MKKMKKTGINLNKFQTEDGGTEEGVPRRSFNLPHDLGRGQTNCSSFSFNWIMPRSSPRAKAKSKKHDGDLAAGPQIAKELDSPGSPRSPRSPRSPGPAIADAAVGRLAKQFVHAARELGPTASLPKAVGSGGDGSDAGGLDDSTDSGEDGEEEEEEDDDFGEGEGDADDADGDAWGEAGATATGRSVSRATEDGACSFSLPGALLRPAAQVVSEGELQRLVARRRAAAAAAGAAPGGAPATPLNDADVQLIVYEYVNPTQYVAFHSHATSHVMFLLSIIHFSLSNIITTPAQGTCCTRRCAR